MGAGSSVAAARARPESQRFVEELKGFLLARDEMNSVYEASMPENRLACIDEVHRESVAQETGVGRETSVEAQLEALYARAEEAKSRFDEWGRKMTARFADPEREMLREPRSDGPDKVFRAYSPAPLKSKERAAEKVKKEYGNDARYLADVVRASIVLDDEETLCHLLETLRRSYALASGDLDAPLTPQTPRRRSPSKDAMLRAGSSRRMLSPTFPSHAGAVAGSSSRRLVGGGGTASGQAGASPPPPNSGSCASPPQLLAKARTVSRLRRFFSGLGSIDDESVPPEDEVALLRLKNRFKHPTFNGYRDCLCNLRVALDDGSWYVVELQIHHVDLLKFKSRTHRYYTYFRTYFSGNLQVVADRMRVLEDIAKGGDSWNSERLFKDAVEGDDEAKLRALDDLLDKLCELDLRERVCRRLVKVAESKHGDKALETAQELASLAELLRTKGRYDQAEPLYKRATEIVEAQDRVLLSAEPSSRQNEDLDPKSSGGASSQGENTTTTGDEAQRRNVQFQTLSNRKNLAALSNNRGLNLSSLGRYAEARKVLERSLTLREEALGANHPDVAQSLNNLANVLKAIGEYDRAVECYGRAIAVKTEAVGPDDPSLATSLINLGGVLATQGKHLAAAPHLEAAHDIRERSFGRDHPYTIEAEAWLADSRRRVGDRTGALRIWRQVVSSRERVLGENHPETAAALCSVAQLLAIEAEQTSNGDAEFEEALGLYERALAIREHRVVPKPGHRPDDSGPPVDHPDVAKTMASLARLLRQKRRLAEAEKYYRRSLDIRERCLGHDHPLVAESSNNLAGLLAETGALAEAVAFYQRALDIWDKCLKPDHPDLATSLNNLALVLWNLGRRDEAIPRQERALEIRRRRASLEQADEYKQELDQLRKGDPYPYD